MSEKSASLSDFSSPLRWYTEADFKNLLPRNVSFHTGRLYHGDSTPRGKPTLDEIVSQTEAAIHSVAQVQSGAHCLRLYQRQFLQRAGLGPANCGAHPRRSRRAGHRDHDGSLPSTAYSWRARIYMVTPYPEEVNKIELKFFSDNGIEIAAYTHFECAKEQGDQRLFLPLRSSSECYPGATTCAVATRC